MSTYIPNDFVAPDVANETGHITLQNQGDQVIITFSDGSSAVLKRDQLQELMEEAKNATILNVLKALS